VAGRTAGLGKFGLARYNRNGALDEALGNRGHVWTDFSSSRSFKDDTAYAVEILADSRIVLTGTTSPLDFTGRAISRDAALARYNPDWSLDTTFGMERTGKQTTDFGYGYEKTGRFSGQYDEIRALLAEADGRLIVAGSTHSVGAAQSRDFLLACYNTNGALDQSFGQDGRVLLDLNGTIDYACALLSTDGKVIVVGTTDTSAYENSFALARFYNSDFTVVLDEGRV
jgi:uncharacterized delta-60 repeat protein